MSAKHSVPKYDVAWVIECWQTDPKLKFQFFWSSKPRGDGALSDALFSQWYPAPFAVEGETYPTSEHWMMAEKARLFGDTASAQAIIAAGNPGKAKALGRAVTGFDQQLWDQHAYDIVLRGNIAKFSADPARADYLLRTGSKILAEASPLDPIWGIGLAANDEMALHPDLWPGTNLLGFALMETRDALRAGQ